MRAGHRNAFTLVELLVIIGLISLAIAIILPILNHMKQRNYRSRCASNLRQIGQGLLLYTHDYKGAYPRTSYVPGQPMTTFTGSAGPDPFRPGGPAPNDVTAAMFMLVRAADLNPEVFLCDGGGNTWVKETLVGMPATARSNFSNKRSCAYSIVIPYPDEAAVKGGYRYDDKAPVEFAIVADINPGTANGQDVYKNLSPQAPNDQLKLMNSRNHYGDGQMVMFNDGHVEWLTTPFCGAKQDHIYTAQGQTSGNPMTHQPATALDTVLVPTE